MLDLRVGGFRPHEPSAGAAFEALPAVSVPPTANEEKTLRELSQSAGGRVIPTQATVSPCLHRSCSSSPPRLGREARCCAKRQVKRRQLHESHHYGGRAQRCRLEPRPLARSALRAVSSGTPQSDRELGERRRRGLVARMD